jgi:DNA processing protein
MISRRGCSGIIELLPRRVERGSKTPMNDLIARAAAAGLESRTVMPARELGAYETLWAREGTSFKTLADTFRQHPGSIPSDFVSQREAEQYSRMALDATSEAGIRHFGIRVHGAGEYPPKLRDAQHPIELLYFQGNWDITQSRCVAIIGTRHPTEAGKRRAAKLARSFVKDDFTVVSGLARGIDTVAHRAAIQAKGRTVAVLGTPITACYPPENRDLQRLIADEYLVISQVPIIPYSRQGSKGSWCFFPERNVTMSALTEATVIVEAGNMAGTLIQARRAIRQNRKLFILDSCFRNTGLTWPAKYLEHGAIRVSEFDEIRAHFAG